MRVPQDWWLFGDYTNVLDRSTENLSPPARVQAALRARGVTAEVHQFPDSTRTAAEAAAAIGTTVGQIVKSLIFLTGTEPVLALVSGANRLALPQLSLLVGSAVGKADADAVRRATGYAIGGVPPVGFPAPIPTYLDRDLLQYDTVWAAAGTPHHVFPIAPADLAKITDATVADLKQD
jgi:prolyl-tRNA editing enzyme YbaK/EbsC (Cys-tRNA(Pro) deacylase)